ncbi:hypothetical protein YC2023_075460 [Brassica napus]
MRALAAARPLFSDLPSRLRSWLPPSSSSFKTFSASSSSPPSDSDLRNQSRGTLKGGRADWLIEKCTELGASSVTPLLTERSSIISDNRVDRLERVSFAAAKQCQRLHQMVVSPAIKFNTLLDHISKSKLCLVATAEATPLLNAVQSSAKESSGLLIVGPEGDFTKKEMEMMLEAGGTAVGLGPHRLRVETATIALLATLVTWSDSQETD